MALAAGVILAVLAVYPQIHLKNLRGAEYEGVFASCDLDEMAYASYLQALIDGRPRKNDPYTGRDQTDDAPQPESLFSIQFVPAYTAAIPARIFGLSAMQTMPLISAFAAFLTALALFWLIYSMTEDAGLAFAGTLIVICGSALIMGLGAIGAFRENGVAYPFFPFLRRYIPSLAFPLMFAFFACLWNGLKAQSTQKRAIYAALASVCFALSVFSYFYVWTAIGAVLFGVNLFALLLRTDNWRKDWIFLAIIDALCVLSLLPYALLLSKRDETMDKAQLLVLTHQPDFLRKIELIGFGALLLIAVALIFKVTEISERKTHFIAAFALAPLLVFNQQILTGRSLQPFHYEFYVVNYIVLLAVVLALMLWWQKFLSRFELISFVLLTFISFAAIFWGYVEARETTIFWDDANVSRDQAMPVNRRLRELASADFENAKRATVMNLEPLQADGQATVAPQPVVWARHQHVFAGLNSWEENKQRYYQLLYYSDLDAPWLRTALTGCNNIEACMALFGWDRFNATLSVNSQPLTQPEVEAEIKNYASFVREFNGQAAENPRLSYVIGRVKAGDEYRNIDYWYERDGGEIFGGYVLYRVKLRVNQN